MKKKVFKNELDEKFNKNVKKNLQINKAFDLYINDIVDEKDRVNLENTFQLAKIIELFEKVVGKRVYKVVKVISLKHKKLYINIKNDSWKNEFNLMKFTFLKQLNGKLEINKIDLKLEDIVLRIGSVEKDDQMRNNASNFNIKNDVVNSNFIEDVNVEDKELLNNLKKVTSSSLTIQKVKYKDKKKHCRICDTPKDINSIFCEYCNRKIENLRFYYAIFDSYPEITYDKLLKLTKKLSEKDFNYLKDAKIIELRYKIEVYNSRFIKKMDNISNIEKFKKKYRKLIQLYYIIKEKKIIESITNEKIVDFLKKENLYIEIN